MKIAIGSDHRGYNVKQELIKIIDDKGYQYHDYGSSAEESVDYPDVARVVAEAVACGEYERGILVCGTGIGVCITANKIRGIRAALCHNAFCARRSRQHNDSNILCLGGDVTMEPVEDIVQAFLDTPFEGGRHQTRVDKIIQIEG